MYEKVYKKNDLKSTVQNIKESQHNFSKQLAWDSDDPPQLSTQAKTRHRWSIFSY